MVERRQFKRYAMPRGTFAILRNRLDPLRHHSRMSIGEIAMVLYKSETEIMGQIANMSYGGIVLDGNRSRVAVDEKMELDLLMADEGIYLHNIPYTKISHRTKEDDGESSVGSRETVLRLKKLDANQRGQLEKLMAHHIGCR